MLSELGHGYDTDWRAASGTGHHEKAGSQEGERQLEKVGHASRVVQTLRAHEDTAGRPGPVDTFFDVLCATHSGAARTARFSCLISEKRRKRGRVRADVGGRRTRPVRNLAHAGDACGLMWVLRF